MDGWMDVCALRSVTCVRTYAHAGDAMFVCRHTRTHIVAHIWSGRSPPPPWYGLVGGAGGGGGGWGWRVRRVVWQVGWGAAVRQGRRYASHKPDN